jgi:MoaA/NifB/PqqE/SkfB family radical SAM enzyme
MKYIDPAHKLLNHIDRIADIKNELHPPPVNVEIDLTNRCNLGCDKCHFAYVHSRGPLASRNTHNTGDQMDTRLMLSILKQMQDFKVRSVTWTGGGEPTLHRDFDEIIETCSLPQGIYTNGTFITSSRAALMKERLSWVYVSLDRSSPESYQDYKKVDRFEQAVTGIRNLVKADGHATVGVGFLLDRSSWANGNEMIDLGLGLGADYVQLRPAIEFDPNHPNHKGTDVTWVKACMQWLQGVMDRPEARQGKIIVDPNRFRGYYQWMGHGYSVCHWTQMQAVITPDARVWTCVNRRGFEGDCLGDLKTESFADVWARSGAFGVNEQCRVMCRGHVPNLALNEIYANQKHGEFI